MDGNSLHSASGRCPGSIGPGIASAIQGDADALQARKLCIQRRAVVDLAPAWSGDAAARRKLADDIAEVCGRVGFFYIKNHGLSDADIAAIFQTSADFHNLPLDAKMEVSITKNNHAQGYLHGMTKGNEKSLSENLQEAFQIKRPLADDDPDMLAGKPLHGKIPWPARCRTLSRA